MFRRKILLPLLAIFLASPLLPRASAQDSPPALVFRVRSLDAVLDNVKMLVSLAGREEAAKQIEGLIKTKIGPKGLEGVDPTRPFGGYVRFGKEIDDVSGAVLLPIADEKVFLTFLENANVPFHKGKNEIYSIQVDAPKIPKLEIFFRFANKYVYVSALNVAPLEAKELPDPAKVLGEKKTAGFSLTLRLDQLPDAARGLGQSQIEAKLQELEDKNPPKETETQKAFRVAGLRELAKTLIAVLKDGSEVNAEVDLDKKSGDFTVNLSLNGIPKSDLAKKIETLGKSKSLFGGLNAKDSALFAGLHWMLAPEVKGALSKVVDEAMGEALLSIQDDTKKKQAESIFKALAPTLKAGEVDGAVVLSGPNAKKTYTVVVAAKLQEGDALSKTLRDLVTDLLKEIPEKVRDKIKLDFDSAGAVKIHRFEMEETGQDKNFQKFFASPYIFMAFRNDAVFIAAGDDAQKAIKAAVSGDAGGTSVFALDIDLARMAPFFENPDLAKRIFTKDSDGKVSVRVEAGDRLSLRIQGRLAIVQFLSQLKKNDE